MTNARLERAQGTPLRALRTIAATATVEIPAEQVTLYAAPPALITVRNCESHLGLDPERFLRILREMRSHPQFADTVIRHGKSLRAASPEAILAYLRSSTPTTGADEDADDGAPDALLRELGYQRTAPAGERR